MTPVYVINLERSVARRDWMERELARAGVRAEFVKAVDASRFGPHCNAAIKARQDETYRLSNMEVALTLSHRKVWRRFLATGARHAVVLEDDVHLGRDFAALLDADLERVEFDIIKLETAVQLVRLGRRIEAMIGDRELRRLRSTHWGTAAYLIRREAVPALLSRSAAVALPIDHFLFENLIETRPFFRVLQLTRAIAIQDQFIRNFNESRNAGLQNGGRLESFLDRGVLVKSRAPRARLRRKFRKFGEIVPRPTSVRTIVDFA